MALPSEITSQDIISGNLLELLQQIITACHSLATANSVVIDLPTTVGPVDVSNENLVRVINKILEAVEAIEAEVEN